MSDLSAFDLAGRRVMVTGASTGIGQGIAVAVARAGASVVGVSRSSMAHTAGLVEATGGSFTGISCDLSTAAAGVATKAAARSDAAAMALPMKFCMFFLPVCSGRMT